jgi:hypothetical protein
MELLEVLITLPPQTVTVLRVLLREPYVPTTADTIDENNEDFTLLWNRFGYWNNQ